MARQDDYSLAPMLMVRFTMSFEQVDYSQALNGPYDITVPLQAIQQEATAKGCAVIVNVGLVPLEDYYISLGLEDQKEPKSEQTDSPEPGPGN